MDWQIPVVLLAVAGSAAYLVRACLKSWTMSGCGSGCGSCKAAPPEAKVPGRIALPRA